MKLIHRKIKISNLKYLQYLNWRDRINLSSIYRNYKINFIYNRAIVLRNMFSQD